MNAEEVRLFRERWQAVNEIERQELRAMSLETRLQKMDSIRKLAKGLGFLLKPDESESVVFDRWASLKKKAV